MRRKRILFLWIQSILLCDFADFLDINMAWEITYKIQGPWHFDARMQDSTVSPLMEKAVGKKFPLAVDFKP